MTKKLKIAENIISVEKDGQKYLLPEVIDGRYEVTDILSANSGFGLILTALDRNVYNRKVLIKARNYKGKIKRNNLDNKKVIEKARNEMKTEIGTLTVIRKINIPNTPVIRDVVKGFCPAFQWPEGEITGYKPATELNDYLYDEPYIVLQYIEGETLKDFFERHKNKIDLSSVEWQRTVLELAKQLIKMFRKLYRIGEKHEKIKKIIYQDLKLENVIVTPSGNFALIDFGGCGIIGKDGRTLNLGEIYTPGYKAPELLDTKMKDKISEKLDVYTLGVLMYILLTGTQLTAANVKDGVLKIDYSQLKCHSKLKTIIATATEPDVEKRIESNFFLESVFDALKDVSNNKK